MKKGMMFLLCAVLAFQPLTWAKAEETVIDENTQEIIIEEKTAADPPPGPSASEPQAAAVLETGTPETGTPKPELPVIDVLETSTPQSDPALADVPETNPPAAHTPETGQPETKPAQQEASAHENPILPSDAPEEDITITRGKMKKGIRAGDKFPVTIKLKNNHKDKKLINVRLQVDSADGISLAAGQKTDQIKVGNLEPEEEKKVKIKLVADQLPEEKSTLELKTVAAFRYQGEKSAEQQKTEVTILLPADSKADGHFVDTLSGGDAGGYGGGDYGGGAAEQKTVDPATPNIIVSQYSYGKEVKAGDEFVLEMTLQNTNSKIAVENTVMSAEAGEGLTIADSSNTFYIEQLKPKETVRKSIKLKALPDGQASSAAVTVSFKYEYLKKEERAQGSSEVKVAMPITHPDRFSVGELKKEEESFVNEETSLTLPYVNKGKSTVYNIEARLETAMSSDETYKFLGNAEAGSSGTIDFFVTPSEAGEQEATLVVTYEDAAGNEKSVERKLTLTAAENEPAEMEDFSADDTFAEEGAESGFGGDAKQKAVKIAAAVILLAAMAIFVKRRRRKPIQFQGEI